MQTNPNTPPQADAVKKPYDAPKLVVMGSADNMTRFGGGFGDDGYENETDFPVTS